MKKQIRGSEKLNEEKYMKKYRGSRTRQTVKQDKNIFIPVYCRKLPVFSDKLSSIAPGKTKFLS